MPTNVRFRSRGRRRAAFTEDELELLCFGAGAQLEAIKLRTDRAALQASWNALGTALLRDWIADRPGTRPWAWWRLVAPEPRQRLGGVGDPMGIDFDHGLPSYWVTGRLVRAWAALDEPDEADPAEDDEPAPKPRRRRGVSRVGNVLVLDEIEPPPAAVDENNPPAFESQAAYLKRLGLLGAAEARHLTEIHFEPELVMVAISGRRAQED